MKCEKCSHGQMYKTKVFRLSKPLVVIGYIILSLAIAVPTIFGIATLLGTTATVAVASKTDDQVRASGVRELEQISGLPKVVIIDYKEDGKVSNTNMALVKNTDKNKVEQIVRKYAYPDIAPAATVATAGVMAAFGGAVTLLILGGSVMWFIIGFLLIMRKKVWRCIDCGYIFERN